MPKITLRPESKYGQREALPDGLPSNIPFANTTLTLYELSSSKGTSGGERRSYTAIQTVSGSLQPLSASESQMYSKETVSANYRFLVGNSVFINATNEGKLAEKNQLRLGTRKFDIIFPGNRTDGFMPHYRVILQEIF